MKEVKTMSKDAANEIPDSETFDVLRRIWIEALDGQIENETLSFFENGGDSLGATIVLTRIKQDFNMEFSLEDFFDYPTLSDLVEVIERRRNQSL